MISPFALGESRGAIQKDGIFLGTRHDSFFFFFVLRVERWEKPRTCSLQLLVIAEGTKKTMLEISEPPNA